MIYYGTHNSATGGKLVWWQWLFGWFIHLTSRCQDRTIEEQLKDGVRCFNLQVTRYKGKWVFSHGLAIYKERLADVLALFEEYATNENPIYFQLYLDDNFFLGQPCEEFRELIKEIKGKYYHPYKVRMWYGWIEGSKEYFYATQLDCEEHYWSLGWAKQNAASFIDWLPLPKRHAEKFNKGYKENCVCNFLMLDFYELG